jgi:predicted HNH restriction endonuclease
MGNQHLAAGKAWFRMTSPDGKKFVPGKTAAYADLFTFNNLAKDEVILRPGVTLSHALAVIGRGRPYKSVASSTANLFPDEVKGTFQEGAMKRVTINAYERDRRARQQCVIKYGTRCCICGLSFGEKYGKEFEGFIHVHHLLPLSTIRKEYKINPTEDLRPVCPNCHAVLHYRVPAYSIEDVRLFLNLKQRNEPYG